MTMMKSGNLHLDHVVNVFGLTEARPGFHQLPPSLQGIAATVSAFRLIASDVRERRLGQLAQKGSCIARPVSKRRPKAVHGCAFDLRPAQSIRSAMFDNGRPALEPGNTNSLVRAACIAANISCARSDSGTL